MSGHADAEDGYGGYMVRHHYRYEYTAPVSNVEQRLIMVPPDRHGTQVLTGFDLEVRGATGRLDVDWRTDAFGNRVCQVAAERVDHAVDFEVWFCVQQAAEDTSSEIIGHERRQAYLRFTALTRADERIRRAARDIAEAADTPPRRLDLAHEWVARAIRYQPGVTGTQTPAALALHLGLGVCQDYAHLLLSLLRTLKIAARYVSGHLPGEGAPHAWVEALLPDGRVMGCDPTHQRDVDGRYIVVATGRDFADVTSTSGVFTGGAIGKLHWSKYASKLNESVVPAA
ncbi:MAG: transglutaminase family protein [Chloroflexi bacterium]|nr:transglutaminase family protein [Chloroflexota bacterium]